MDKRSGAMQRRMDSHKMPAHPPLHSPVKKGIALTHSSHSLYDDASTKRKNNKKKGSGSGVKDATGAAMRACSWTQRHGVSS